MHTLLMGITAHRTKDGLKTVKREVVGYIPEDAEQRLDRLASILVDLVMRQVEVDQVKREVAVGG